MKRWNFLYFLSLWMLAYSLEAETKAYEKKQWILELQGGALQNKVSDDASPERFTTLFYTYDVGPLLSSANPERRNLGIAKAFQYQESRILNQNARLGVEYAIFSWLGIGGSFTRSNTRVTNVLPGDYLILASLGVPVPAPRNDPPELTNFGTFFPRTLNASLTSSELEASLHLPVSVFDLYVRGGIGQLLEGGNGRKESISFGTRIVFEQWLLSLEFYRSSLFSDLGRTDFFREEGIRVGGGIRLVP